jgi:glutathione S-transferase
MSVQAFVVFVVPDRRAAGPWQAGDQLDLADLWLLSRFLAFGGLAPFAVYC